MNWSSLAKGSVLHPTTHGKLVLFLHKLPVMRKMCHIGAIGTELQEYNCLRQHRQKYQFALMIRKGVGFNYCYISIT